MLRTINTETLAKYVDFNKKHIRSICGSINDKILNEITETKVTVIVNPYISACVLSLDDYNQLSQNMSNNIFDKRSIILNKNIDLKDAKCDIFADLKGENDNIVNTTMNFKPMKLHKTNNIIYPGTPDNCLFIPITNWDSLSQYNGNYKLYLVIQWHINHLTFMTSQSININLSDMNKIKMDADKNYYIDLRTNQAIDKNILISLSNDKCLIDLFYDRQKQSHPIIAVEDNKYTVIKTLLHESDSVEYEKYMRKLHEFYKNRDLRINNLDLTVPYLALLRDQNIKAEIKEVIE